MLNHCAMAKPQEVHQCTGCASSQRPSPLTSTYLQLLHDQQHPQLHRHTQAHAAPSFLDPKPLHCTLEVALRSRRSNTSQCCPPCSKHSGSTHATSFSSGTVPWLSTLRRLMRLGRARRCRSTAALTRCKLLTCRNAQDEQ